MILLTADLHLNNLSRDQYRHDFQNWLRKKIKELKIELLFIVGDLTDEKNYHSSELVNKVTDHVAALTELCDVLFMTGNHDYSSLAEVPFFTYLRHLDRVSWIGEPATGGLVKGIHPMLNRCLFLPHTPDWERDWEKIDLSDRDFIFAHNTFTGASADSGRKLEGIPINIFPKGTQVLSGDIHTPQSFGPVTYIGAPYTVDFGDDYEPRVLQITKDMKLRSIPCEGPQKRLVDIKLGQKLNGQLDNVHKGDILKIRAEVTWEQYTRWSEFKDGAYAWAAKWGYTIHSLHPVLDKKTAARRKEAQRYETKSDREVVRAFGQRVKFDEATIKIGERFLEE